MLVKKKAIIFLVVFVSICSVVITAFAGKAEVKAAASAEDPFIPTNGYLDDADAIYFLRFVFNDSGQTGGLSDDDIINSDFFKMCTGRLAGTEEEMVVIKAFLLFLYPQVNRYVSDGFSTLNSSRARLQTYLEDKCGGLDNLDEEAFNEVRNEALDQVKDGIVEFLTSQLAQKTRIVVSQSVLDDMAAAAGVYRQIKSLPDKVENFVNTLVTATSTCLMPMASEMSGRYSYFSSYLNCRNLGAPDDVIFQTAMDYNFLACKNNSGLAAGVINCIPGKVKWTERRHLIEHWAEFVYQLEQKRDGQPIGTIDTSTYYYENPTADETIDFNWKLYDNGILVIWGEGALSYSRAPWENQKDQIKQVYIDDGITSIGKKVFYNYSEIQYVSISDSVESIDEYAFFGCSSLTELTIPGSVKSIGGYSFSGCTGLAELKCQMGEVGFSANAFYNCSSISRLTIEGSGDMPDLSSPGSTAWYSALKNDTDVEVTVADGVTGIGKYAFSGCSRMGSIRLPETVTSIGESAFSGCGMKGIEIPEEVTAIGKNAFYGCTNLMGITVPVKVTEIGEGTFYGCLKLRSAVLEGPVTVIGKSAFRECGSLEEIEIPGTVESISGQAFTKCSSLTELTIPGSVKSIGGYAFSECTGLAELTCQMGEVDFSVDAFYNCSSISRLNSEGAGDMPDLNSPISTAWYSALNCGKNVEVTVGDGVTSVGQRAFEGCSRMGSINLPETVTSIGENAFYGCSLDTVYLPYSLQCISSRAFYNCNKISDVYYNGAETDVDNILIESDNTKLLSATWHYAFEQPGEEKTLRLPDQLLTIEEEAFAGMSAEAIVIPATVETIKSRAFADCVNLKVITFEGSPESIANDMLSNPEKVTVYVVEGSFAEEWAKRHGCIVKCFKLP